jgi:hypothetical protein
MIREYDFATAAVPTFSGTALNTGPGGVAVISGAAPATIAAVTPYAWVAFGTGLKINSIVSAVNYVSGTITLNQPAATPGPGQYRTIHCPPISRGRSTIRCGTARASGQCAALSRRSNGSSTNRA